MQCFSPLRIRNPSKFAFKQFIDVPCGKCPACIANKRQEWIQRLSEVSLSSKNNFFITLTYSESSLPRSPTGVPTLDKADAQKFVKRLRGRFYPHDRKWYIRRQLKPPECEFKYFLCGEYGDTFGRPHYHALLFNVPDVTARNMLLFLRDCWPFGFVRISQMNGKRIAYCTKYALKQLDELPDDCLPPFHIQSQGIGILDERFADYLKITNKNYVQRPYGVKRLSRYSREKMQQNWTDDEIRHYQITLQKNADEFYRRLGDKQSPRDLLSSQNYFAKHLKRKK